MNKRSKKLLALLLVTTIATACDVPRLGSAVEEVQAATEVTEVSTYEQLQNVLKDYCAPGLVATAPETVSVKLMADITVSSTFELAGGDITLDLNGHELSSAGKSVFASYYNDSMSCVEDTSKLTICDSSVTKAGKIDNMSGTGVVNHSPVILKQGGCLIIDGGNFAGGTQCITVTNSELKITDGNFSTPSKLGYTLMVNENCDVDISDGTFVSHYTTLFTSASGSSVTIEGGTFKTDGDDNGEGLFSFVCGIDGSNNSLDINGGEFISDSSDGISLVVGSKNDDKDISLSGGVYEGRIACLIEEGENWNYTKYYGNGTGDGSGIIADGCVMTDNTLSNTLSIDDKHYVCSADKVEIVKGRLVKFNTQRSLLETYAESESVERDKADYYSITPVSVGKDGKVYENSGDNDIIPTVSAARVTDNNTYTFDCWYDAKGTECKNIQSYIEKNKDSDATKPYILNAGWTAKVSSSEGMKSALDKKGAVSRIELTDNILQCPSLDGSSNESQMERTLDLRGFTIDFDEEETAGMVPGISLQGNWNIKNGNINSKGSACLLIYGKAVIENLNCKAEDSANVVMIKNTEGTEQSKIISGRFETTSDEGYVVGVYNGKGTPDDITNMLSGVYASSKKTTISEGAVYLDARKLVVSKSPFTYIENGTDLNFGTHMYGNQITASEQIIRNKDYTGDITISDVTVDSSVFEIEKGAAKTLRGGSDDTYSYKVGVAKNTSPGSYEGKVTVKYIKMDGTEGEYKQRVTLTIGKPYGTASVSIADYHVGEQPAFVKAVSDTNGADNVTFYYKRISEGDEKYTTVMPTEEGDYVVKAVFAETECYSSVSATAEFKVSYIETPANPYKLTGSKSDTGWYRGSVTITPATGYTVSSQKQGVYTNTIVVDETTNQVIYLKNASGAITKAINVGEIKIDKETPVILGITGEETYYMDNMNLVVKDSNLEKVWLNGSEVEVKSKAAQLSLTPSDEIYTIKASDNAGNTIECSFRIEEAWMKDGIISNVIRKLRGGKEYKLGAGKWKVKGDNTVYNGGMNFYVSDEGEYDFQMQ